MTASARLAELGIELPAVAKPLASYVPAVRSGNLVYTSGQLPTRAGTLAQAGKVGVAVTPEEGKELARSDLEGKAGNGVEVSVPLRKILDLHQGLGAAECVHLEPVKMPGGVENRKPHLQPDTRLVNIMTGF